MNTNRKSDLHQISDAVSCDSVFVALAQYDDFVSPVDLAIDLGGISVAIVRHRLQELGRCFAPSAPLKGASALFEGCVVENDGRDCWRVIKNTVFDIATVNISLDEKQELLEIENKIFQITEVFFVELGECLKRIRDRGLYKTSGYKSFATYCRDRFGYGKTQVHHIISAAKVVNNLKRKNVHHGERFLLPTSERQVRPLAKLEPAEQIEVWTRALADSNGKIPTGRKIQHIVNELKESNMESSRAYKVEQQIETESDYPKLEIDARYGKIERYLIPIKDERLKQKIEQYARVVGAATLEGAIARLLIQVQDE